MAGGSANRRVLAVALAIAASLAACGRLPPEQRQRLPSADGVSATPNAVGIPYGRVIVVRHGARLIAVSFASGSSLGDRVSYAWHCGSQADEFSRPESLEHGEGEAVERPYTGRVSLPDRLLLEWSRGSDTFGWLYWPQPGTQYAVYSRPFADLDELSAGLHGGRWLTRDMFQE